MRGRWSLAIVGVVLILAGGLLAHFTQTADGIRIEDVRFKGAKGNTMFSRLARDAGGPYPAQRAMRLIAMTTLSGENPFARIAST